MEFDCSLAEACVRITARLQPHNNASLQHDVVEARCQSLPLERKHKGMILPQVMCIMLTQGGRVDRLRCKAQH